MMQPPEGMALAADARAAKVRIKERIASALSLMPAGLHAGLSLEEFADLIAYLSSLRGAVPPGAAHSSSPEKPAQ